MLPFEPLITAVEKVLHRLSPPLRYWRRQQLAHPSSARATSAPAAARGLRSANAPAANEFINCLRPRIWGTFEKRKEWAQHRGRPLGTPSSGNPRTWLEVRFHIAMPGVDQEPGARSVVVVRRGSRELKPVDAGWGGEEEDGRVRGELVGDAGLERSRESDGESLG